MAERGHSFVPIAKSHIDHFAISHNCEPVEYDRVVGYSLVDRYHLPLACAGFYFEPEGNVTIFAHLGRWMGEYPVPILRLTRRMFAMARELGITELYCVDEEQVGPKARSMIEWAHGRPTGKSCYFGPIYKINLSDTRL